MLLTNLGEIIAQRVFNTAYIYLDICFLVFLCAMLVVRKKYLTLLWGLAGGVLYMLVDYGIFHLWLGTRSIQGGNLFWVLLWMSFSYGITNFVWIWLWMARDEHLAEWSIFIWMWWIAAPLAASIFNTPQITIQRTTGSYHGAMGVILFVGYAAAIVYNLLQQNRNRRFPLLWLLAIGVMVQFAWEFSLLIGGIRSAQIDDVVQKLTTLVVNSLVETNLGVVPIYCIYLLVTSRYGEDLRRLAQPTTFWGRMEQLNATRVRHRDAQTSQAETPLSALQK